MDDQKYAKLLEELRPEMMSFATVALRQDDNPQVAEDLVQNALMRLWTSRDDYDPDKNVRPGVMAFLKNEIRRYWRDKRVHSPHWGEMPETVPSDGDPEERYIDLYNAIEWLRGEYPRRADILWRYYWLGQSGPEIGEEYGISRERVRQLRSDAEEHIASRLGAEEG